MTFLHFHQSSTVSEELLCLSFYNCVCFCQFFEFFFLHMDLSNQTVFVNTVNHTVYQPCLCPTISDPKTSLL